ncbi:MAG: branched-chain amino acid ABC transporter permease [Thermoplasmata archaeon]|nr:branched-chain amino acid ABC transporter permease [Candidatus Sysuiplasma acidicola]MBX8646770.1 branched-chain amino acid ABC transporter permease [Candidatus Sysuiplasma acidicola]
MALGLNIVFGTMKIVNLAHGDFIMLGGLLAFFLLRLYHVPLWMSFLIVAPAFFVGGYALYTVLIPRVNRSDDREINSLIAFFGISMSIEAIISIAYGTTPRSLPLITLNSKHVDIFGFSTSTNFIVIAIISVAISALTFFYLYVTRIGKITRAVMYSEDITESLGINSKRIALLAFSISVAITGIAGIMSPWVFGAIVPYEGALITIIAFTIIIIGALGNPLGAILGGLLYGVIISISDVYAASWSFVIVFTFLVVVMVIRPQGIFGRSLREA